MDRDMRDLLVIGMLIAIFALLVAGFQEIFTRLRPRVIYVHDSLGQPSTEHGRRPADEMLSATEKTGDAA
jgi:FtsZ-interacting cell division protein ZipA